MLSFSARTVTYKYRCFVILSIPLPAGIHSVNLVATATWPFLFSPEEAQWPESWPLYLTFGRFASRLITAKQTPFALWERQQTEHLGQQWWDIQTLKARKQCQRACRQTPVPSFRQFLQQPWIHAWLQAPKTQNIYFHPTEPWNTKAWSCIWWVFLLCTL